MALGNRPLAYCRNTLFLMQRARLLILIRVNSSGETFMKKFLFALLLSVSTLLNGQISIGVKIGAPPPPRVLRVRPASPGPDHLWIDGYWFVEGGRYRWHDGYWTRRPYEGAFWVGPRHDGAQFFNGHWDGPNGRFEHEHRWDKERGRDFDRRRR